MRTKLVAPAMAAALAGTAIFQAATSWAGSIFAPATYAVGALMGAAAFGITRRSVPIQIASRGAIFVGLTPFIVRLAVGGHPSAPEFIPVLLSAGALWLSRPMLETPEAKEEFAPARFRNAFLAGATTLTGSAIAAAAFAIVGVGAQSALMVGFNSFLAVVFLLAVRGLLKMRTWGLLLGAFGSLVCLAMAPFYGPVNAVTLSLAAAPALLLWVLPLIVARVRPVTNVRVAVDEAPATRIAEDEDVEEEEEARVMKKRAF